MLTFGSVCSGIEAASVAWEPLGMSPAWFSEISPFQSALLAHRFTSVPNLGDMTSIEVSDSLASIDVLVGGTPCQAFSVAGLRNSLDDDRGNLSLAFCRLSRRIAAYGRLKFVVWENVPGVLSTKDNAFGCVLAGLVGEPDPIRPAGEKWTDAGCVYGPEGAAAWRCLDAQYVGLAQRRKRVFVVFCPGGWTDPAKILFEWEGMRRDSPPSRTSGESIAASLTRGADSSVRGGYAGRRREDDMNLLAGPLDCRATAGGFPGTDGACSGHIVPDICGTLSDGTHMGRGLTGRTPTVDELSRCLNAGGMGRLDWETETFIPVNGGAFEETAHTLRGEGFDASEDGTGRGTPLIAVHATQDPCVDEHLAFALGRNSGQENAIYVARTLGSNHGNIKAEHAWTGQLVPYRVGVRRLTPRECERLQGFPDDWTLIPYRGKPASDGPRYQAIGNSMATNVMRWIGRRIVAALKGE